MKSSNIGILLMTLFGVSIRVRASLGIENVAQQPDIDHDSVSDRIIRWYKDEDDRPKNLCKCIAERKHDEDATTVSGSVSSELRTIDFSVIARRPNLIEIHDFLINCIAGDAKEKWNLVVSTNIRDYFAGDKYGKIDNLISIANMDEDIINDDVWWALYEENNPNLSSCYALIDDIRKNLDSQILINMMS